MTNRADVIRVLNLYYGIPLDTLVNPINEAKDYKDLYITNSGNPWATYTMVDLPRYEKENQTDYGDPTSATEEDSPDKIKKEVAQAEVMSTMLIVGIIALVAYLFLKSG
jgi:hypothetical protein